MNAFTLWAVTLIGCIVCAAGGALALPRLVPRGRPTPWVWARSVGLLIATAVMGIAVGRLADWDRLRAVDEDAQVAIAQVQDDLLERTMAAVTGIGEITATGFVAVLLGLALGYQQRSVRLLIMPVLVYWLALRAQRLVDMVDDRPRPDPALAIGDVGGYPSGGTIRVVVIVGVIVVVLAQFWRTRREVAALGAIWGGFSWIEVASRSILGRHWPLDLVGGVIIGVLLLWAVAPLLELRDREAAL